MNPSAIASLIIFALASVSGCMSLTKKQQMFKDHREYDIGRSICDIPVPEPTEISPTHNGKSEYLFEFKNTGCQWIYVVDDSTHKVESWRYVSDPQKCFLEINWRGPW